MKYLYLTFAILFILQFPSYSQISYGGSPHFVKTNQLRLFSNQAFFQMPSFDLDSILMEDSLDQDETYRSYRFAHKFMTDIEKKRDAQLVVLADGTKVWTLTIQSSGAYSLNFLMENVSFPEGGKLFVYNADYSHVIGSFDWRNVSDSGVLPIQPVAGETIIIEYSEFVDSEFEGNFNITEVNHDYRDFLRREPATDRSNHACMPDVLCEDVNPAFVRSTVLLMIDGTYACSGTLLNNTEENDEPYVLTAVHCLTTNISISKNLEYYNDMAKTVVAFFNYDRTACGTNMKGTMEMSVSGAVSPVIFEKRDVALLRLNDIPPAHYNVYYAGWTLSTSPNESPYYTTHHPQATVKKYGMSDNALTAHLLTISNPTYTFASYAHWKVNGWTVGSTDNGSSGSPLFNKDGLLVGGLTGGNSYCSGTGPNGSADYYFSFAKAWAADNYSMGNLKTYLNPNNKNITSCSGYDPHKSDPIIRLNSIDYQSADLVSSMERNSTAYVFGGNNTTGATEFAEAFYAEEDTELMGAYLLIPAIGRGQLNNIKISIYTGMESPEQKIKEYTFNPSYMAYFPSSEDFEYKDKTTGTVGTENFVRFDNLRVKGNFFISYQVNASSSSSFRVYNTVYTNAEDNTAWIKAVNEEWVTATNYPSFGKPTSLAIIALVSNNKDSGIELPGSLRQEVPFYYDPISSVLKMKSVDFNSGYIKIYSITGQLIEDHKLLSGKDQYTLTRLKKGSVNIVKIRMNDSYYTMKIIS